MLELTHPKSIRLEASTHCQLKCPSCPTAQGEIHKKIGGGFLKFERFRKLIEQNPSLVHIELSNWGEIFLNPELIKIMEYAYKKNIALTASNGANLNTVKQEVLESLVKYKFRYITCSIDGASQETYSQYRVGGNFERVVENIKIINQYKEFYRTDFPILTWQFIAFGHNEHEINLAKKLAQNLNMKFWLKLSWNEEFSPVKQQGFIRLETTSRVASQSEYLQKYKTGYMQKMICRQLWQRTQVNWDGRVLGCCVNYWGDFGNAFESDLINCLNGEKINYARKMLLGSVEAKEGIPCTTCVHYKKMLKTGSWLTPNEVRHSPLFQLAYRFGRLGVWLTGKSRLASSIFINLIFPKMIKEILNF